jgi:hypothetical protein
MLSLPAVGRTPLSLRRVGVAAWAWWIPTIGLLGAWGIGIVFAPSALGATIAYLLGRHVAKASHPKVPLPNAPPGKRVAPDR